VAIQGVSTNFINTPNEAAPAAVEAKSSQINKDEFLKLLMTQMKYQDPEAPMDSSAMMQQLIQLSALEQSDNMSKTIDKLSETLVGSQLQQGSALLGKTVVAQNADNTTETGIPTAVRMSDDGILEFLINNKSFQMGQIKQIGIVQNKASE
jgi:flagellar basal-body rod modification protein FlgD